MEHTTLHLLYSRFWNQFLFDIGVVPCSEPYQKRTSHGMILGEGGEKMSKSRGNVVNPDDIVEKYGADALRLYEMFMGPFDQAIAWNDEAVQGMRRFLERVWALQKKVIVRGCHPECSEGSRAAQEERDSSATPQNDGGERLLHKTIKKVTEDIEGMKFNTAISALMILTNELSAQPIIPNSYFIILLKLLNPFAPHITEELWERIHNPSQPPLILRGGDDSITPLKVRGVGGVMKLLCQQPWPRYDSALVQDEEITLVVQINGKVRETISVNVDIDESTARELVLKNEKIKKWLTGQEIKKVIFIKGKLINVVTG